MALFTFTMRPGNWRFLLLLASHTTLACDKFPLRPLSPKPTFVLPRSRQPPRVGRCFIRGGAAGISLDTALRSVFSGLYRSPAPKCAMTATARNLKFLAAGAVAGLVSRTLVSPLEVVATLNMAAVGSVEGPWEALVRLWTTEGMTGLYKGNGANCLKVAPTKGIQFVSFEFFKRQY
mmetsp:Transcript_28046/g.84119  ORF Transcript_28046/g.84119 Transcript_28046/m.84119 type:complete len:177 (-) Transcript_28046:9-539(-)